MEEAKQKDVLICVDWTNSAKESS